MIGQRLQEILAELEGFNFQELLNITRDCFRQAHKEKGLLSCFEVVLDFNWNRGKESHVIGAEDVIPLLKNLSEEGGLCLAHISINPVVRYADASGVEQKFQLNEAKMSYSGAVQAHWKELRFKLVDGKEQTVSRNKLGPGCIVAQTQNGPLKVLSMSDNALSLVLGTDVVKLVENNEYMAERLPGVEAALYYDHDAFPARWQWLFIDDEIEGEETPWYRCHRSKREEISEGMEFVKNMGSIQEDPMVRILEIKDEKVTLLVRYFLHSEIVALDQPNREVVIWQKGKRSLKAKLYVPEPDKDESYRFQSDPIPEGSMVTYSLMKSGEQIHERRETKAIRMLPGQLRPENYNNHGKGVIYNWPYVWGFINGKMVVGMGNPKEDRDKCVFWGLLSPGRQYTFSIGEFRDWEKEDDGQVTIGWECEKVGLEITDGVLKSIPDQEELLLPEEVREIHHQALLSAPSLRKITIHSGVTQYSSALEEFHKKLHVKLDVAYEGALQQWFDSASCLAGHIGRLLIQGKEYDFYEAEDLVIPEGVSRIGKEFFCGSETLRSVVMPREVAEIGPQAFAFCSKLQRVKVLGPAAIGSSAFSYCSVLSDIHLEDGVVSLAEGCFDGLAKVESIFIPLSVETVGRICSQGNEDDHRRPKLYCAAPAKPSGWSEVWNLAYFDTQFGFGCGHDFYLPTYWGQERKTTHKSLQNSLL